MNVRKPTKLQEMVLNLRQLKNPQETVLNI